MSTITHGGRGMLGRGPRCPHSQCRPPPHRVRLPQSGHPGLLCDPEPVAGFV